MFSITALFIALLALVQIPITVFVGYYRAKSGILLMDGGDDALIKRIRAHANFTETVPISLLTMAAAEYLAASAVLLWTGGSLLLAGRLFHYAAIREWGWEAGRGIGMIFTFLSMILFSVYCLLVLSKII